MTKRAIFSQGFCVPIRARGTAEKFIELPNGYGEDFVCYVQPTSQALAILGDAASTSLFIFVEGRSGQGDGQVQQIRALRDLSGAAGGQNIPTFGTPLPLVGAAYQARGSNFYVGLKRNAPLTDEDVQINITFSKGRLFTRVQNELFFTDATGIGRLKIPAFATGVRILLDAAQFLRLNFYDPGLVPLLPPAFTPLLLPDGGFFPIPPDALFFEVVTDLTTSVVVSWQITE